MAGWNVATALHPPPLSSEGPICIGLRSSDAKALRDGQEGQKAIHDRRDGEGRWGYLLYVTAIGWTEIAMYRSKVNDDELSQSQLDAARLGFVQYLRRKRFSPQFIATHGDDLFAIATLEYSRKIAEGANVENPAGWLITCAWRRTKSLLEAQSRTPRLVSTERSEALTDDRTPNPEDAALEEDRFRKVQDAVAQLSDDERRLLELAYFEGMAVREAARMLRWHPSKAQRCHEAARRRLHELLGADNLDDLEIEIGLAAYLAVAVEGSSGVQVRAGIEAAAEVAARGAADLWARAQDLARRVPLGGNTEPSTTAMLGGGAGRAAGACATAALACIASGVVGSGVGGVDLIGGPKPKPPGSARQAPTVPTPPADPLIAPAPTSTEPRPRVPSTPRPQTSQPEATASASAQRKRRAQRAASSQFAVESAGTEEASPVASESEASSVEAAEPETSSSSSTPTEAANEQFGLP